MKQQIQGIVLAVFAIVAVPLVILAVERHVVPRLKEKVRQKMSERARRRAAERARYRAGA